MSATLLLLAAGKSERFSGGNKLLADIAPGVSVVQMAITRAAESGVCGRIIVAVCGAVRNNVISILNGLGVDGSIVDGGERRMDSVRGGLAASSDEFILIHDCARPLASKAIYDRVYAALETGRGVIPALAAPDTVYETNQDGKVARVPDRKQLLTVQTPQGFPLAALREFHERARREDKDYTDDGSLFLDYGLPLTIVEGERINIKITTETDLNVARVLAKQHAAGGGR